MKKKSRRPHYRLVCFDLWWTLVTSNHAQSKQRHAYRREAFRTAVKATDAVPSPEAVSKAMVAEWGRFNQVHHDERRTLSNEERAYWLAEQLHCELDERKVPALVEAFEDSLFVTRPNIVEGMADLIRRLSDQYTLAIISDTSYSGGRMLRKLLADEGMLEHFSVTTFSDEMGSAKPHRAAFERTLEAVGIEPSDAVHIGDREDTDVCGAQAVGMDAVLFLAATTNKKAPRTKADHVALSVSELATLLGVA